MPDRGTVRNWLADPGHVVKYPGFADRYAGACQDRADLLFDEILAIADDPSGDWVERTTRDGETHVVGDHDHIHRSRLRVDTRKWILSKMLPRQFGDRATIGLEGPGGGPLQAQVIDLPEEVADQIRAIASDYVRGKSS